MPLRRLSLLVLLAGLVLASCKGEADFDQRYQQSSANLEAAASTMQQELQNRMAASNRIEGAGMPAPSGKAAP